MTETERKQMAEQIKCLENTIEDYQSAIINLEGSDSVVLLAKGIENTARELGKLEGLFENNIYTDWKLDQQ